MKGERIASAGMSEVFAWGDDRVLKLFRPEYAYAIGMEFSRARAVRASGVASPEVFEVVELEGRKGIVYERIHGRTLLDEIRSTEDAVDVGARLALVHLDMHTHTSDRLKTLRQLLEAADQLSGAEKQRVLDRLQSLPESRAVCHGDMHPGNVILSADGPVIVDWVNGFAGHPALDVGRSLMAIRFQGVTPDMRPGRREARKLLADGYERAYLARGTVTRAQVDVGIGWAAAALLRHQPETAELSRLAEAQPRGAKRVS